MSRIEKELTPRGMAHLAEDDLLLAHAAMIPHPVRAGELSIAWRGKRGGNTAVWRLIPLFQRSDRKLPQFVGKLASAPAYWEANMESVGASDNRQQLDQAANALMASLRKSRDLNIEIRQTLLLREQADSISNAEDSGESRTAVRRTLSDIVGRVSRL
jgi:hypothetical protein